MAVGLSGVFVNLVIFVTLLQLGPLMATTALVASCGAFVAAMSWNFGWNYIWAFDGLSQRSMARHFVRYAVIQAGVLGINLTLLYLLVTLNFSPFSGQLSGILIGSSIGFLLNSKWNFTQDGDGDSYHHPTLESN